MWLHIIPFILLLTSALKVEEVQELFRDKHCVEASLISLDLPQEPVFAVDKTSKTTITTSKTFEDKGVLSMVHELAHYNQIEYTYELIAEEGPPHNKNFNLLLKLGDETYQGSGSSLKKAQNDAATQALSSTLYQHPPTKLKTKAETSTPKSLLNNISQKLGFAVTYYLLNGKTETVIESFGSSTEAYSKSKSFYPKINSSSSFRVPTEEPQATGPFRVKVKLLNGEFIGIGFTIKSAGHDAATKALQHLEKTALLKNDICSNDDSLEECKQRKKALRSPISLLYEAAQQTQWNFGCDIIEEFGKSHKKNFVTQCRLGDYVTEGEGKSKKESKRNAAEKMLPYLPDLAKAVDTTTIVKSMTKKRKKKKQVTRQPQDFRTQVADIFTAFWGDSPLKNDHVERKIDKGGSPKEKILEVGSSLDIDVQFMDLDNSGDEFVAVMSLGVKPLQVCLGRDLSRDKAHDNAALHGLRFLKKSGILDEGLFKHFEDKTFVVDEEYVEEVDVGLKKLKVVTKKT